MQVKQIVEQHATERILITGEDYPAPERNKLFAKLLGSLQVLLLALILAGETICKALGINTPDFVKRLQESKWMYAISVFFIGNNI
jgi:hypothetical protein